jgi:hypothetical protein
MKINFPPVDSTILMPVSARLTPIAPAAANIVHPANNPYHIHVRLIAQKSISIVVSADTRIIDLRMRIREFAGAPINQWRLVYLENTLVPSRELRDEYLISDCRIPHTATVWAHSIPCVN